MRILWIFPHPDDESFGPALDISKLRREGHEAHLLTLTRGGATKQRFKLGLSVEQMGEVRHREMLDVAKVLGLASMEVLDFPDSRLKELDPRRLESAVRAAIDRVAPQIVVTYPLHGISGFEDHVVTHAIVKRVFCEMRDEPSSPLRRLAFFTLAKSDRPDGIFHLRVSAEGEIDCTSLVDDDDVECARRALTCYASYAETVAAADPLGRIGREVHYEIFGEEHAPRLPSLADLISAAAP